MTVLDQAYTRRRFLQLSGAVGATVGLGGVLSACNLGGTQGGTFNWLTWGDHYIDSQLKKIEESDKIIANISELAGNAEGFAKLKEVKGQLDMISGDALWVPNAYNKEGLIEPFDINDLKVASQLYPFAREFKIWTTPEGYLGYPFGWSPISIYYNPKYVDPAPDSWAVLLDPKYKGHIVMSNPSTSGTAYLLLASHAARLGVDKMWPYYDAIDKNLSQVTKSGGAPGRMAASGETPIGIALAYEVEVAKKQGAAIDVIYPNDGVAWTFEGNALVKGAKNPQNAKRFLDWAVSKSAMASYASWRGAGIARGDVAVAGQKISEMNLINIDFVKAGDPAYKDRLVKRWLEKFSK